MEPGSRARGERQLQGYAALGYAGALVRGPHRAEDTWAFAEFGRMGLPLEGSRPSRAERFNAGEGGKPACGHPLHWSKISRSSAEGAWSSS